MVEWKNLVKKPEGSLPGGLLTKVMVGLGTVLVLLVILSTGFGGGEEEEADQEAQDASTTDVRPAPPVERELEEAIDLAQRRVAAEQLQQERFEQEQRRLDELQRDLQSQNNPDRSMREGFSSLNPAALPDPAAVELERAIQLEDLERRIRSVRTGPVAQTFRSGNTTVPTGGERDTARMPAQLPGVPDAQALLRALQGPVGASGPPSPGQLDIPLPNSNRLPDYENPPRLITPDDPEGWQRVYEGSWLEAVLVTQLSGEFPGPALAHVSVPFYSADRQRVIIPRGTRLVGSAQAVRRVDQARLAVGFHRMIFLDGRHVPLRFLGLDQAGASGLPGDVDRHYFSTFLAAGAVGILSGFAISAGNPYGGGFGGALSSAGPGTAQTGQRIVDRFLNRLPTITVPAGTRLRVWFTSDVLIPRPPPA